MILCTLVTSQLHLKCVQDFMDTLYLHALRCSSVAMGGFGGLNPPKQSSKLPKLKRETL